MHKHNCTIITGIALSVISLIVVIVFSFLIDDKDTCIICDCFLGVFASSVVALFIEVGHHFRQKQSQRSSIENNHKAILGLFDRYLCEFYQLIISNPPESNMHVHEKALEKDFSIADMTQLFNPSNIVGDNKNMTMIQCFFEAEERLRNSILSFVVGYDLSFFPNLRDSLLMFVNSSYKDSCKSNIVATLETEGSKGYLSLIMHGNLDELNKLDEKGVIDLNEGKYSLQSHIVYLYRLLNDERKALLRYSTLISAFGSDFSLASVESLKKKLLGELADSYRKRNRE